MSTAGGDKFSIAGISGISSEPVGSVQVFIGSKVSGASCCCVGGPALVPAARAPPSSQQCTSVEVKPDNGLPPPTDPSVSCTVICTTPAGVGADLPITLKTLGGTSPVDDSFLFSYAAPTIYSDVVVLATGNATSPSSLRRQLQVLWRRLIGVTHFLRAETWPSLCRALVALCSRPSEASSGSAAPTSVARPSRATSSYFSTMGAAPRSSTSRRRRCSFRSPPATARATRCRCVLCSPRCGAILDASRPFARFLADRRRHSARLWRPRPVVQRGDPQLRAASRVWPHLRPRRNNCGEGRRMIEPPLCAEPGT